MPILVARSSIWVPSGTSNQQCSGGGYLDQTQRILDGKCVLKVQNPPSKKGPAYPKFLGFQQAPRANKILKKSFDNGLMLMV